MPIINPWIFYLINVLSNIGGVCLLLVLVSSLALLGLILYHWLAELDSNSKIWESFIKWRKRTVITLIISILGLTIVPYEETMYKMLVASYVTDENIETATDVIKDSVDYIFSKLDGEEEE